MTKERELLRRALEGLKYWIDESAHTVDWELIGDIEDHLAAEEGKQEEEPIGQSIGQPIGQDQEPVGYVYSEYGNPRKSVALNDDSIPNGTPVYLHLSPQAEQRKPLSDWDMFEAYDAMDFDKDDTKVRAWASGVRFAEKHHGIGGEDE